MISIFTSSIVGTLIGTYVANFVLKSGKVIEEKGDSLEDIVSDTIDKGKEFIGDMTNSEKTEEIEEDVQEEAPSPEIKKEDGKSARERLKDKGYL